MTWFWIFNWTLFFFFVMNKSTFRIINQDSMGKKKKSSFLLLALLKIANNVQVSTAADRFSPNSNSRDSNSRVPIAEVGNSQVGNSQGTGGQWSVQWCVNSVWEVRSGKWRQQPYMQEIKHTFQIRAELTVGIMKATLAYSLPGYRRAWRWGGCGNLRGYDWVCIDIALLRYFVLVRIGGTGGLAVCTLGHVCDGRCWPLPTRAPCRGCWTAWRWRLCHLRTRRYDVAVDDNTQICPRLPSPAVAAELVFSISNFGFRHLGVFVTSSGGRIC